MSFFTLSQSYCPQKRKILNTKQQLIVIVRNSLDGLEKYGFAKVALKAVKEMQMRYMYTPGILEDIQRIHSFGDISRSRQTENSISETVEEQLQNSCVIMQNEADEKQQEGKPLKGVQNYNSFQNNLNNNKSLVGIINILYRREIRMQEYSKSLRFFLKWANVFQQHSFAGFLRNIYKSFYKHLKKFPKEQFLSIVDQVCVFVQFMVSVITEIYGLRKLAQLQIGKLIKNENVYNLIMSILFKKFKIKRFLIDCIRHNERDKIDRFEQQLMLLERKPTLYFGIGKKFTLYETDLTQSEILNTIGVSQHVPYEQSLKLVEQLVNPGSPVTKLKIIIAISKQIMNDIKQYYSSKGKEAPELDPDNLSSIVMYLLAKAGKKNIYEQLKLVQHFTTTNCLNCISGYYLNVFVASIDSLLELL